MPNQTECPRCGITWEGEEIPMVLAGSGDYNSREEILEAASHYGWTRHNRKCFSINVIGIEIPGYDGVSIWHCTGCGAHINRFSGEVTVPSSGEFSLAQSEGEA
jgi:hypothetical protein